MHGHKHLLVRYCTLHAFTLPHISYLKICHHMFKNDACWHSLRPAAVVSTAIVPSILFISLPSCSLAFTAMLLAAMFGLTWAVVAALKDTKVESNGYMYVKGSSSELVKVRR